MVPETLFPRQDQSCVACPSEPPPCNCASNQQCVVVNRDCNTCSYNKCVALASSSTKKGGVSAGAVAGAVVAVVVFLIVVVLAFLWYRRRARRQLVGAEAKDGKTDAPARAEDVLNRPDPNEKTQGQTPQQPTEETSVIRVFAGNSNTTINLDPEARGESAASYGHNPMRGSVQSDPFRDSHSIQTTSTGTQSNVIPIALVPPGSMSSSARSNPTVPSTQATSGSGPMRPDRDPELNLNLDHTNVSSDISLRSGSPYDPSQVSGISNNRNSYMTTGSFASDLLNETPVIITPTRGTVKQVLGVVKAEVIRTPGTSDGTSLPASADSLRPSFTSSRPPMRSPLAASSFGPSDVMHETEEEHQQEVVMKGNPFGDEHSPYVNGYPQSSPVPSASTIGNTGTTPSTYSGLEEWTPEGPRRPWAGSGGSKHDSMSTQAGSIISANIVGATRVHVGLDHLGGQTLTPQGSLGVADAPVSATLSSPRTPAYRMTSAKLVSPMNHNASPAVPIGGALESQQRRALDELDAARRISRSSVVSSTSTRADSILEGFPFVPPSPISDRPLRTPPRSPLAQQAFTSPNNTLATPPPTPPNIGQQVQEYEGAQTVGVRSRPPKNNTGLPPPSMNRKVLGLSTASESSTMSNGLGAFPFQIDSATLSDTASNVSSAPPSSNYSGRQRASLDTLALTSDLSSYPLGFDQNIMDHYPGARQ